MARTAQFTVEGLDDLRKEVRRLKDKEVSAAMREANATVAAIVVDDAKPHVPRLSGRLAASLRIKRDRLYAAVKMGGARVPYAAVIHWGWPRRGIPARPFVTKAVNKRRKELIETYTEEMRRVLDVINAKRKGL